jgi:hypothetical protein
MFSKRGENFDPKANERFLQNVPFLPEPPFIRGIEYLPEPEQETGEEKFLKAIKSIFEGTEWEFVDIKCVYSYENLETAGVLLMREKRTGKTHKVPLSAAVFEYVQNCLLPNKICKAANSFAGQLKALRHISESSYTCLQ